MNHCTIKQKLPGGKIKTAVFMALMPTQPLDEAVFKIQQNYFAGNNRQDD